MEKEYSNAEMIKVLKKDPTRKFVNKSNDTIYTAQIEGRNIRIRNIEGQSAVFSIGDKWTIAPKKVSFMEAVQAYHDGHDIYCIYDSHSQKCHIYKVDHICDTLIDDDTMAISTNEILCWGWYIQE